MAGWIKGMGWRGTALVASIAAAPLSGQALWLPASDPVGIGRAGTGVAFGRSMEAGAQNPALLVTLTERRSLYVGLGLDLMSQQVTQQSNQITTPTSERNRFMPAFGMAWRVGERAAFGLVYDQPFSRHGRLPNDAPTRFDGLYTDLVTRRLTFQGAYALTPAISVGLGLGVTSVSYTSEVPVRLRVTDNTTQPTGVGNPSKALNEIAVSQEGKKTLPCFQLGVRYALLPRWTLGAAFRSRVKGDLTLTASRVNRPAMLFQNDGFGQAPDGLEADVQRLNGVLVPTAGTTSFALPAMASVGVRHRLNQIMTWELDIKHVFSANLHMPGVPGVRTPDGLIAQTPEHFESKAGTGISACVEFTFGKSLTTRIGAALDPGYRRDGDNDVLYNGARTSAFSFGFGYKAWGGEVICGYQFRQTQDMESARIDSAWTSAGPHRTGTYVRMEAQGHLFSLGYKKVF